MSLLLDSDILIGVLRGHPRIRQELARPPANAWHATSAITVAELYYGAARSNRPVQGALAVLALMHQIEVIPVDERVSARFANLKARLRASGQMIPDFDLLIAATALVHDRALVTHNTRHFSRIAGLTLLDWLAP
ncbi:MAG: type II toxin-antitoxin system VapC family toxin [Dehalococcoidia bacterium]